MNSGYIIYNPQISTFIGNSIDLVNLPRVSFCIPTLNNQETIDKCLNSIVNQNYPDIEIIIVDGCSKDGTIEIAKGYTSKIYIDKGSLGSARQTSIEHSTGYVLALFDSDIVIPHNNWLINQIKYFNYSNDVSTVWSTCKVPSNASLIARMYRNLSSLVLEQRIKNGGLIGGGNALFLKNCLLDIGGINKSIHWGEDFDWARRLRDRGFKVVVSEEPLYHDTMRSLGEYVKKQIIGARTFSKTGFGIMDSSKKDIIFIEIVLGFKQAIRGLIIDKDISWILFPLLISIRILVYAYVFLDYKIIDKK